MTEEQITEIKKRIRESREKRGYSVKEIADTIGVCVQAVYKWENTGETCPTVLPSLDNLVRFCELFNVSADYLLFGR